MWLAPGQPTIVMVLLGGGPAKGPVPGPWHWAQVVTPWCTPVTEYTAKLPAVVWHCAHTAVVGMWFAGLVAVGSRLVANTGVVTWQLPQSPEVGCLASSAVGRESPAPVALLASMPRYGALS